MDRLAVAQGSGVEGQQGANPSQGFGELMKSFGGVQVNGRNMFMLLQGGEAVLLYPGGVREVGHPVSLLVGLSVCFSCCLSVCLSVCLTD